MRALLALYRETIERVAVASGVRERRLRDGSRTSSSAGRAWRRPVLAEGANIEGLPVAALERLLTRTSFARKSDRGAPVIELAHDRLIEPIQAEQQKEWRKQTLQPAAEAGRGAASRDAPGSTCARGRARARPDAGPSSTRPTPSVWNASWSKRRSTPSAAAAARRDRMGGRVRGESRPRRTGRAGRAARTSARRVHEEGRAPVSWITGDEGYREGETAADFVGGTARRCPLFGPSAFRTTCFWSAIPVRFRGRFSTISTSPTPSAASGSTP